MLERTARLADRLALRLISEYGVSPKPDVDVHTLARRANIEIDELPLDQDGYMQPLGDGRIRVVINVSAPRQRQRFTLAHELGHYLVHIQADAALAQEARQSEEVFCNIFAGSLLMPRDWLEDNYAESPPSLQTLVNVARQTQVSLSAAAVRLRDVFGWRCVLLQWERQQHVWELDAQAGLVGTRSGFLADSEGTPWALQELSAQQRNQVAWLPVRWDHDEVMFLADVSVRRERILALVQVPTEFSLRPAAQRGMVRDARGPLRCD
jgi:hypothetical protein